MAQQNIALGTGPDSSGSESRYDAFGKCNSNFTDLYANKAATTHTHSGADIATGTVNVARIGTGTKTASTFYCGDGTFKTVSGGGSGISDSVFATPEEFGAVGDGTTNDTAAFNSALASGRTVVLSPKKYLVNNVTAVSGCRMVGFGGQRYAQDTLAGLTDVPVLVRATGNANPTINIDGTEHVYFSGFTIHGGSGNARTGSGFSGGGKHPTFDHVTILQCNTGIGDWGDVSANYMSIAILRTLIIADCNVGIGNMVDSVVYGGAVAGCQTGVRFQPGASSNNIIGLRVEWTVNNGYEFYQAGSNQVIGGMVDRTGKNGVSLEDIRGAVHFTGVHFRRNASSNNATEGDAHILLKNNSDAGSQILFSNCSTTTGLNDDGGGTLTPRYCVRWSGTNGNVTLMGSDFRGFTSSAINGTTPANTIIVGCRSATSQNV